jgi:hypothetical protein
VTRDESQCQFWGLIGRRTILGKRLILENKAQIRKIQMVGKVAHAEENT